MAEKSLIDPASGAVPEMRWLGPAYIFAVAAFTWLRFSDNLVDNDLWGHVLYGQRVWLLGHVEKIEVLSWTAAGLPWINHESWAEIILGLVHRIGGGTGLWLFMVAAATSLLWALYEGAGRESSQRWIALSLLAASVNFIALGYAVRPQLFTLIAMVALLALLRRFFAGRLVWGVLVPPLFAVWVNLHGGYLAGWMILLLACFLELQTWGIRDLNRIFKMATAGVIRRAPIMVLAAGSTLALALNPWGARLVLWTVETLRLPRPQITEWQPLLPTAANFPFYVVVIVSLWAWITTRRIRPFWEAATLGLLAIMAILHQRHAPLFGLANLMLTPPHLWDAVRRFSPYYQNLRMLCRRPLILWAAVFALSTTGVITLCHSVALPREHPFTIEVPRDTYPVSAIDFMRRHALAGNTLTFFDWGQQVLWELPGNAVSFDGRLDTVYSTEIMQAHWRFYSGEAPGPHLDLHRAEIALLPTASAGAERLRTAGWQPVYQDPLAIVLVKIPAHFPSLLGLTLPEHAGVSAISGRVPFPDAVPALATLSRPR